MASEFDCKHTGCCNKATCVPILIVVPMPGGPSDYAGVRSVMWLPLCNRHIIGVTARDLITAQTARSISVDMWRKGAQADLEHARVERLRWTEPEFKHWEAQMKIAMARQ